MCRNLLQHTLFLVIKILKTIKKIELKKSMVDFLSLPLMSVYKFMLLYFNIFI